MCSGLASTPHQPLRPALMRAVPIASELGGYSSQYPQGGYGKPSKKWRGFLEELFD